MNKEYKDIIGHYENIIKRQNELIEHLMGSKALYWSSKRSEDNLRLIKKGLL